MQSRQQHLQTWRHDYTATAFIAGASILVSAILFGRSARHRQELRNKQEKIFFASIASPRWSGEITDLRPPHEAELPAKTALGTDADEPEGNIGVRQSQGQQGTVSEWTTNNHIQKWEYSVFASHLDPAELVILLNKFGSEGWELVTMVAVTDYHLPEVVELMPSVPTPEPADVDELIPVEAFRYILKRPSA